jgi:hypothetical protein
MGSSCWKSCLTNRLLPDHARLREIRWSSNDRWLVIFDEAKSVKAYFGADDGKVIADRYQVGFLRNS